MTRGRKFRRKSRSNFEYLVSCRLLLSSRWYRRTGFKFVRRCCECVRGRLSPFDKRHVGIHTGAFLRKKAPMTRVFWMSPTNEASHSHLLPRCWPGSPSQQPIALRPNQNFWTFAGPPRLWYVRKALVRFSITNILSPGCQLSHAKPTIDTMKRYIVGSCCIYNA